MKHRWRDDTLAAFESGVSRSRREALRTTLWLVPASMVALAVLLFVVTYNLDWSASHGQLRLPAWVNAGGADEARQTLIAIAAAVITVAGVVFSITILVLQLASQQFGPRMLRLFIRDTGTQVSIGAFVATFAYSIVALGAVQSSPAPVFVPHLSVSVALGLTLVDLCVLIYFIHHVALSIQLTTVVSGIARDFRTTLAAVQADARQLQLPQDGTRTEVRKGAASAPVFATESGFLQAIGHKKLVRIAAAADAVITLSHRPGHFLVHGQVVALVAPPESATAVSQALAHAHLVGANRTLTQDVGFAIDQLVEVAIRALSPATNDPFTALNCIDWLGDCLCRAASGPLPSGLYGDEAGALRLVEPVISLERLVKGATDKIRQAGRGMPAIMIRQLENLSKLVAATVSEEQIEVVLRHASMIVAPCDEVIPEASDRADIRFAFDRVLLDAGLARTRLSSIDLRARV